MPVLHGHTCVLDGVERERSKGKGARCSHVRHRLHSLGIELSPAMPQRLTGLCHRHFQWLKRHFNVNACQPHKNCVVHADGTQSVSPHCQRLLLALRRAGVRLCDLSRARSRCTCPRECRPRRGPTLAPGASATPLPDNHLDAMTEVDDMADTDQHPGPTVTEENGLTGMMDDIFFDTGTDDDEHPSRLIPMRST